MSYVGLTASPRALVATGGGDPHAVLERGLSGVPADAPVVVLIHGYRFDPASPLGRHDPHRSVYGLDVAAEDGRARSWPAGLGFHGSDPAAGLCVGFGWPASEPHLPNLIASGRNGFAAVYDRAALMGRHLARVIARLQELRPGLPVDVMAHSLGARVALSALGHLDTAPGRMVLLGAAEFDGRAEEALDGLRGAEPPQIYNVTARANDFYDAVFETFAPRRSMSERAIGQGLRAPRPFWLDLQLDRADLTDWINDRGIPLSPARARMCHWSFYTRAGTFGVYQAILRRRPGWDIPLLRAEPCFNAQEPRWSRMARVPGPAPGARPAGLMLRRA